MRKNIVFIFIFVFWSLGVCMILSAKIEEQMTAEVVLCKKEAIEGDKFNVKIPLDALFYDEEGAEYLYEIINGEGWELGKRVSEVEHTDYSCSEECIVVYDPYADYIRYASKKILPRQLVRAKAFSAGDRTEYLITDKKETARIVSMESQNPYMEEAVRQSLDISEKDSIYYLNDVRMFLKILPLLAGLLTLLLCSVLVWGYSWRCAKNLKQNKILLAVNGGIYVGLFLVFKGFVQKIQLPSSLLPDKNIFDWGHYREEFSEIYWGLQKADGAIFEEIVELCVRNIVFSGVIVVLGVCGCAAVLAAQKKLWNWG